MAKSILPKGVQEVKFKDLTLFANLVEWVDTRKPRLASHEFLKRDGGQVEPMGRAQAHVKMTLVFVGETFADQFAALSNSIDQNPRGTLIHPLYGRMQVACEGIDGAALNVEQAGNLYTVPISFIEDNLDVTNAIQTTGVGSKQQDVSNAVNAIQGKIAKYTAISQGIINLCRAAMSFTAGATSAFQSNKLDPTLGPALQAINASTATTIQGVWATGANSIANYDTVVQLEILLDACNQLLSAISVAKPQLISYTMPMQMHVATLAQKLYGAEGRARIDEILMNNPGKIPNPSAIAAGVVLLVAQPTQKVI